MPKEVLSYFLKPTAEGCRFCPNKPHCPARAEEVFEVAQITPASALSLTGQQMAKVLALEPKVKALAKELRDRALEGEITIPGYVVEAKQQAEWAEGIGDEVDAVLRQVGASAYKERSMISISDAKQLLGKRFLDSKKEWFTLSEPTKKLVRSKAVVGEGFDDDDK
jgi:hypothetical protein